MKRKCADCESEVKYCRIHQKREIELENQGHSPAKIARYRCANNWEGEEDPRYQGWTNWDTWNANLWLTNDCTTYHLAQLFARQPQPEEKLRDFVEAQPWQQSDSIDLDKVNFQEIIEGLR